MFLSGEKLLSINIVAKRLNKDVTTITRWLRNGKMKGVKTSSKRWAVRECQYNEYLQNINCTIY